MLEVFVIEMNSIYEQANNELNAEHLLNDVGENHM